MIEEKPILIPFSKKTGDLAEWDGQYSENGGTDWRENYAFATCLLFDGFSFGRSASMARMKDAKTGIIYPMFISEFEKLLNCGQLNRSSEGGTQTNVLGFSFAKKGTAYGLIIV